MYKDKDSVYIIGKKNILKVLFLLNFFFLFLEHFNNKILRLFWIKLNNKTNNHLIRFFAIINSLNVNQMNPAYNPFLLNGLINFYHELKMDRSSFLNEYYRKNKHLLTDEEEEEDLPEDPKIKRVFS